MAPGGVDAIGSEIEGLAQSASKVHDEKDRKLAKLHQLALNQNHSQSNATSAQEVQKRKVEAARKAESQSQLVEEIAERVKVLENKVDTIETRNAELQHHISHLQNNLDHAQKANQGAIFEKVETVMNMLKTEEENRERTAQELQQMIRIRETKFKQSLLNEINEEAKARMGLSNDVVRLGESLKDLKANLDDESAKINAKLANTTSKLKCTLADLSDQLQAERFMRERADTALKTDFDGKIREFILEQEVKMTVTDQEQTQQLTEQNSQIEILKNHVEMATSLTKELVDELDKKRSRKLSEATAEMVSRLEGVKDHFEEKIRNVIIQCKDLKQDIKACGDEAARNVTSVQTELAQEHLRREQDESNIVNMLEIFMKQVKDGHLHD